MHVIVSNNQSVYGLTKEQKSKLKDYLTYDNPKYKQAKRYGRGRYTTIPPYLYYFIDHGDYLEVPFGVNLREVLGDFTCDTEYKEVNVDYPDIKIELRQDQKKAFYGFFNYERNYSTLQNHYGIIQLPTGKGKTILAIYMAYILKQKTLILVHKDDLVVGWQNDIKMCFDGKVKTGLIKAKSRTVGEQITIATVQTLSRMSEEELSQYTNQFGMIVQDEVHHVGASTFNIVDMFSCYYKVGLSATPNRSDGLDYVFDLYYGGIVYKHEYVKEDKDILPVEVRVRESRAKYRPFVVRNDRGEYATDQFFNVYDYKVDELPSDFRPVDSFNYKDRPRVPHLVTDNAVVLDKRYKIRVCKDILNEARKGHSCLALFTQKEHINVYYNYLKRFFPENKIMKYYGDSKESSSVLMKRAESKEVLITLGTLAKSTEGTNVKSWEVLFLVSSMNNEKNVEQATGRIRRTKEGKLNPVIVYDYIHPLVVGIQSHFTTRLSVYRKLKYDINYLDNKNNVGGKKSLFSKGYNSNKN